MKSVKLLLLSAILGVGAMFGAGQAHAWSAEGSANSTCDGTSDYWGGYFYASTYQWASADDDKYREKHSFSFAGFLEGFEHAGSVRAWRSHVIYRNGWLDLAVPYQAGAGMEIRDNRYDYDTDKGAWYILCHL